jgi:hypothetical protein
MGIIGLHEHREGGWNCGKGVRLKLCTVRSAPSTI